MTAWAEDQGIEGSMITFMADPVSELTAALDMGLTHPGPSSIGLVRRCKRFAMHVVDGTIKVIQISEREDDPAGDDFPEDTLSSAMLKAIRGNKENSEL
mmetsp:Transcript_37942/g.77448  ORF Transcript_37942/g.77448 Transcript_37942/m.77448 type:complete len:99 (-) Transcript_37942:307-603(-)